MSSFGSTASSTPPIHAPSGGDAVGARPAAGRRERGAGKVRRGRCRVGRVNIAALERRIAELKAECVSRTTGCAVTPSVAVLPDIEGRHMPSLIHVADRVLNRPLPIAPEKAQVILSVLAGRIGVDAPEASRFEGADVVTDAGRSRPRHSLPRGERCRHRHHHRLAGEPWRLDRREFRPDQLRGHRPPDQTAAADPAVHSVILDMHSPGEAVGAFETAALVRDLAASKRTVAIVNGMAASVLRYCLRRIGDRHTQTGVSGSIGVVLHADFAPARPRRRDADADPCRRAQGRRKPVRAAVGRRARQPAGRGRQFLRRLPRHRSEGAWQPSHVAAARKTEARHSSVRLRSTLASLTASARSRACWLSFPAHRRRSGALPRKPGDHP